MKNKFNWLLADEFLQLLTNRFNSHSSREILECLALCSPQEQYMFLEKFYSEHANEDIYHTSERIETAVKNIDGLQRLMEIIHEG